jgi:hypothetical protein
MHTHAHIPHIHTHPHSHSRHLTHTHSRTHTHTLTTLTLTHHTSHSHTLTHSPYSLSTPHLTLTHTHTHSHTHIHALNKTYPTSSSGLIDSTISTAKSVKCVHPHTTSVSVWFKTTHPSLSHTPKTTFQNRHVGYVMALLLVVWLVVGWLVNGMTIMMREERLETGYSSPSTRRV